MRVAVMIIGLVLMVGLFFQSLTVNVLSDVGNQEASEAAGAIGILMAVMWLVACALIIPFPRVSMVVFAVAGLFGFIGSSDYPDLAIWGAISLVLAVLSYVGFRGKRKSDRKSQERDELLRTALSARQSPPAPTVPTFACPRCGEGMPVTARFCPSCGLAFGAQAPT